MIHCHPPNISIVVSKTFMDLFVQQQFASLNRTNSAGNYKQANRLKNSKKPASRYVARHAKSFRMFNKHKLRSTEPATHDNTTFHCGIRLLIRFNMSRMCSAENQIIDDIFSVQFDFFFFFARCFTFLFISSIPRNIAQAW